ncbi:ankyrin repeat-containing domain protein [Chaetomium sp. MPI-SDFR-AT-0129]|nr:ankyrin repeat-containing domain protein [Chaetomium sp. MPI-SDFR-AT-0129]
MDGHNASSGRLLAPVEVCAAETQGPSQTAGTPRLEGKRRRSKYKHLDWNKHRSLLDQLYVREQKTLEEVMEIMQSKNGFVASKQAFKRVFKGWGFRRYGRRAPATHCTPSKTAASPATRTGEGPEPGDVPPSVITPYAAAGVDPSTWRESRQLERLPHYPYIPTTVDGSFAIALDDELPDGHVHVDDVVDRHDMAHDQSRCAIPSFDTDFMPGGPRARMLVNIPWLRFRGAVHTQLHIDQSPAFFIPHHLRVAMGVGSSEASLSTLTLALHQSPPLKGLTAAHNLASILEQAVPSLTSDAVKQFLWQLLHPSAHSYGSQMAELVFGLISNNLVAAEGMKHFLNYVTRHIPQRTVHALFCVDTITVDAVAIKLLNTAVENGDESALEILLEAGINQKRIAGRKGTDLLRAAIQAEKVKVAERLLRAGTDPNPGELVDVAWGTYNSTTPLHAAVSLGKTDLVKRLLDAGAQVDRPDLDGNTALALAVKHGELTCASLLLGARADVDKAWVNDEYNDDIRHSALDYAFLVQGSDMCQLLSERSAENQQISVSLWEILSAARRGVRPLQAYLQDRIHVPEAVRQEFLEKALLSACCYPRHEAAVDALLASGVDPNVEELMSNAGARSPLYWAVRNELSRAVGSLQRRGAKVSGGVVQVASSSLYMLQILTDHGVRLNLLGQFGLPAAVRAHNMNTLRFLLQARADVDSLGPWGRESPIQVAASVGNLEAVKLLILSGADKNEYLMGRAANTAAALGKLEILKVLVESGVPINEPTDEGATLLEACARCRLACRSEIFNYLLEAGAEILHAGHNDPYRECDSLLTELIKYPQDDGLVRLVLDAGVQVNVRGIGRYSRTAIQAAAAQGDLDLVKELCRRGAEINAPAGFEYQRTALQAACNRTVVNRDLVKFLLEQGADVNAKAGTCGGVTALQAAAIQGHTNLAIMLIKDFGADVNADPAIQDGRTALEGAAEHGRLDLVQILLNAGAKPRKGQAGFKNIIKLAEEQAEGRWAVADLVRSYERGLNQV